MLWTILDRKAQRWGDEWCVEPITGRDKKRTWQAKTFHQNSRGTWRGVACGSKATKQCPPASIQTTTQPCIQTDIFQQAPFHNLSRLNLEAAEKSRACRWRELHQSAALPDGKNECGDEEWEEEKERKGERERRTGRRTSCYSSTHHYWQSFSLSCWSVWGVFMNVN